MNSHSEYKNRHEHLRDEKNHMEGVMNNRFNAILIVLGVSGQSLILLPGRMEEVVMATTVLVLLLSLLVARACNRLLVNLDLLAELGDVTKEIKTKVDSGSEWNPAAYSWVKIQGYYIPFIASVALLTWTIFLIAT
jgi:hypothetical protein